MKIKFTDGGAYQSKAKIKYHQQRIYKVEHQYSLQVAIPEEEVQD